MSSNAVEIKSLGILFRLYSQKRTSLKETVIASGKNLIKSIVKPGSIIRHYEDFWALKDVSLSVGQGEVLGIIGENGSGKSTLLKTIAGIFAPDEGEVIVRGRVGALLELGAGFHNELTGSENIYLNGAILGLKKDYIDTVFDEIVHFSELDKFIDIPLKNYSSGMRVRLGFSIAVHIKPQILLIDEALSVGDIQFQRKCFQKFEEFREKGVTVIFVSHNLLQVRTLCDRTILLSDGKIIADDNTNSVVNMYTRLASGQTDIKGNDVGSEGKAYKDDDTLFLEPSSSEYRYGNRRAEIERITVLDDKGKNVTILEYGTKAVFVMKLFFSEDVENPVAAVTIKSNTGIEITGSNTMYKEVALGKQNAGKTLYVAFTMNVLLNSGQFFVSFGLVETRGQELTVLDRRFDAFIVQIIKNDKAVGFVDLWEKIDFSDDLESVIS